MFQLRPERLGLSASEAQQEHSSLSAQERAEPKAFQNLQACSREALQLTKNLHFYATDCKKLYQETHLC